MRNRGWKTRRTFPHRLILLRRAASRRLRRRRPRHFLKDGLRLAVPDPARRHGGSRGDSREIHPHEAQDHVVCGVWNVIGRHMRCVEELCVYMSELVLVWKEKMEEEVCGAHLDIC